MIRKGCAAFQRLPYCPDTPGEKPKVRISISLRGQMAQADEPAAICCYYFFNIFIFLIMASLPWMICMSVLWHSGQLKAGREVW